MGTHDRHHTKRGRGIAAQVHDHDHNPIGSFRFRLNHFLQKCLPISLQNPIRDCVYLRKMARSILTRPGLLLRLLSPPKKHRSVTTARRRTKRPKGLSHCEDQFSLTVGVYRTIVHPLGIQALFKLRSSQEKINSRPTKTAPRAPTRVGRQNVAVVRQPEPAH